MQISMKYGCRKTIRDKTLHVWNSACIVNNYLLRQEEKLRLRSCRTMLRNPRTAAPPSSTASEMPNKNSSGGV